MWLRGAMVAHLTPDQKVACSNHLEVIVLLSHIMKNGVLNGQSLANLNQTWIIGDKSNTHR